MKSLKSRTSMQRWQQHKLNGARLRSVRERSVRSQFHKVFLYFKVSQGLCLFQLPFAVLGVACFFMVLVCKHSLVLHLFHQICILYTVYVKRRLGQMHGSMKSDSEASGGKWDSWRSRDRAAGIICQRTQSANKWTKAHLCRTSWVVVPPV